MGDDDEAGVLAGRNRHREWWRKAASRAASVKDLLQGPDVDGVSSYRFDDRLVELGRTDGIEEEQQLLGRCPDISSARCDEVEEGVGVRRCFGEAVEAPVHPRMALLCRQPSEVLGELDLLAPVPGAGMDRHLLVAVGEADGVEIGEGGEGAQHPVVGDRVVVEIEAGVGCFADFDFDALSRRKGIVRERKKARDLLVGSILDGALPILDPGASGGIGLAPAEGLLVEIGEVVEEARLEKALTDISNRPLYPSRFPWRPRRVEARSDN
jgi:hypothetical protein